MKCAFYEKEITPPLGGNMPGYFNPRYASGVDSRLYAKAAVFEGGSGETAAIVLVDCVRLEQYQCEAIAQRAEEVCGIPAEHVIVAATHIHTGLPTALEGEGSDPEYLSLLLRLVGDTVALAYQRLRPCKLTYAVGRAEGIAFNRDYVMKDGSIKTNPGMKRVAEIERPYAGTDPDLPVLFARDEEGALIGALYTFACHQDTAGTKGYCGDYSSVISEHLKAQYGHDFVAIYLPGFSGDINHVDFLGGKRPNYISIGGDLSAEILRVEGLAEPLEGDEVAIRRAVVAAKRLRATPEQLEWAKANAETNNMARGLLNYEKTAGDFPPVEELPVHGAKIGDCWLFALPGEPYHQYGEQIKEAVPTGKWLLSERANSKGGYFPVPELYGTGCYAAQLTWSSFLEPATGTMLAEAAKKIIKEME